MRKRQESIEIATVLLDAHAEDQNENLQTLLVPVPVQYEAEDLDRASALYNRTYTRMSGATSPSDVSSIDDEKVDKAESREHDSLVSDRTFSLEKPTLSKTSDIPSAESTTSKDQKHKKSDAKSDVRLKKDKKSDIQYEESKTSKDQKRKTSDSKSEICEMYGNIGNFG